jgi:hypothetical protein
MPLNGEQVDDQTLSRMSSAAGITCIAIGAAHAASGLRGLPGAPAGDASLDSQERFFGPIFAAYGLAWMRAGRRQPPDLATIDIMSGAMLAGGVARLLSMADRGRPHPFYIALTAIEFVVPPAFLVMTRAARRRIR